VLPSLKRVLVATDFSPTANAAVTYAYALADPGAEVHLLHVIEHEEVPNPLYAHYSADELATPESRAKAVKEVERHLLTLVPEEAKAKTITTVVGCVLYRDSGEGIVAEARRRKADALVMGSHGRTGLKHLLMGSVAEHVLRAAGLPVLVIPHHE
jgi:nucleotide-binding universal stress UspA family protein